MASFLKNAFLVLSLVVFTTGCDSQNPSAETDDRPSLVRAIPDTTLYTRDEAVVLDLTEYIGVREGRGIYFTLQVDGDAVRVERGFNQLSIQPVVAGTATVTLAFSGESPWEESFDVVVRCPTQRPHDLVSYFPHEIGQTWNYTYEKTYLGWQAQNPANTSTTGDLRWIVAGLDDRCDYIEIAIDERFDGSTRRWSAAFNYDSTVVMSWDKTRVARLVDDKLAIEGYTDGTYRGLDSLQWLYPAEMSDIVSADSSKGLGFGMFLSQGYTLEKGTGITRFRNAESGRWTDSIELTLIR